LFPIPYEIASVVSLPRNDIMTQSQRVQLCEIFKRGPSLHGKGLFTLKSKTWCSGPGQKFLALPVKIVSCFGVLEYWSVGKS
jgi:hypothetical protein